MKIKLSFFGAAQNVTGSKYLLEANGSKILVDCGLYQEHNLKDRNWDPFPVPPNSIDVVLLTHAHLDHCGLLPKLVREGFKGKIYCTEATAEIAEIVLLDSAHIQEEDAAYKKKRHEREGRKTKYPEIPLYTIKEARYTLPLFTPVEYEKTIQVKDSIEASFHEAGHILGSSSIKVRIKNNGEERNLIFSGDVGRWGVPILQDPVIHEKADYIIVESTYGDKIHGQISDINSELTEIINLTRKRHGNVVIPSFTIGRTQELLYHLNELLIEDRIPHLITFIDSPMAVRVTKVFQNHPELFDREMSDLVRQGDSPFNFRNLKMITSTGESKSINHIKGTTIIIAGSGMCTGGRIKHHLVHNISRHESTVLFVGYQAVGTLGRQIVDGDREVRILGQMYPVKALVKQISGFSAHADKNELLKWLSGIKEKPRHVFVTHGEPEAARSFARLLNDQKGWKTSVPAYRDEVNLDY
ncbi:MBL fold metallo-hydrolase [Candidatus Poribacteria bacterium]|nr:MBL fold metallo-hydrolase [Candidatus Poribacteria bacterium]